METKMDSISSELRSSLKQKGFSDIEILEVPTAGSRMVRLQTLEEILTEVEHGDLADTVQYIVRARKSESPPASAVAHTEQAEDTHTPDGKLNVPFLMKNADILLDAKEIQPARSIFQAILKSGDEIPLALIGLSRCDEAEGKVATAIEKLQHAVTYDPNAQVYKRLIELEISRGDYQRAGEVLSKAFRSRAIETKTQHGLHNIAIGVWEKLERYDLIESHCEALLDVNPNDIATRMKLVDTNIKLSEYKDAERNLQEVLRRTPSNASALALLGHVQMQRGDIEHAYESLVKSLEIQIRNPTAIVELVRCAHPNKKYAKAAELLKSYIDLTPVHPDLVYSLAGLQFHLGRFEEARRMAQQVLDMKSDHSGSLQLIQLISRVV